MDTTPASPAAATASQLSVVDERTGTSRNLPIHDEAIDATELRAFKVAADDPGLVSFDPGFVNTAACRSAITYIDGDRGILEHRGYPIEQIAERGTFLEIAYLLIKGELPGVELASWEASIAERSKLPDEIYGLVKAFPKTAHPMNILIAGVAALGGIYPDARDLSLAAAREEHGMRLIAQVPLIVAAAHRHGQGLDFVPSEPQRGYVPNFLNMTFAGQEVDYQHTNVQRGLEVLFLLHADHEQNCSTNVVRGAGSSDADPYSCMAAGLAALSGPLHGGANEAVLVMLREIGSLDRIPDFEAGVKSGKRRLMGFGHRVYKNYDPRARVIKKIADKVFEVTGVNPLLAIAIELEKVALADPYFIDRKLYPNVDFYSGLVYEAVGLPAAMFTALFALARISGWVAHWLESWVDKDRKIARPRQLYIGSARRDLPANA
ncbi:MAG TPA: citrate/2-methylcitrate synthase [Thermomicrobiaceae bacterium]|nr:citrate/2-methylcitrate synthase [Thermomicrobiaceae bacterium]